MGTATPSTARLPRKQAEARRVAKKAYTFRCCVVCGLQLGTCITVAHLDHNAGNNEPDNLAYLCQTHHWMYDAGFYPVEVIRHLRAHWQSTKGIPDHGPRMRTAGADAARTRKRRRTARKAADSRRRNWEQAGKAASAGAR